MMNPAENSPLSLSGSPTEFLKSNVSSALPTFRNPFEERDPTEVWKELLEDAGPPIGREEAIKRMVEAARNRAATTE